MHFQQNKNIFAQKKSPKMITIFSPQNEDFLKQIDHKEDYLEKFLVQYWKKLFPNFDFIKNQFVIGNARFDVLAYNPKTQKLIIFELKRNYDANIESQVFRYENLFRTEFANILLKINEDCDYKLHSKKVNPKDVELLLIAQEFEPAHEQYVKTHTEKATLIKYRFFENIDLASQEILHLEYLNNAPKAAQKILEKQKISKLEALEDIFKKDYELLSKSYNAESNNLDYLKTSKEEIDKQSDILRNYAYSIGDMWDKLLDKQEVSKRKLRIASFGQFDSYSIKEIKDSLEDFDEGLFKRRPRTKKYLLQFIEIVLPLLKNFEMKQLDDLHKDSIIIHLQILDFKFIITTARNRKTTYNEAEAIQFFTNHQDIKKLFSDVQNDKIDSIHEYALIRINKRSEDKYDSFMNFYYFGTNLQSFDFWDKLNFSADYQGVNVNGTYCDSMFFYNFVDCLLDLHKTDKKELF